MDVQSASAAEATVTQTGAAAPPPSTQGSVQPQQPSSTSVASSKPASSSIAPAVAKLFADAGVTPPAELSVSYRVVHDPNIIVTVFTNAQTGEEVAQFPPELLIGLAQFFDQQQGATFDQNA